MKLFVTLLAFWIGGNVGYGLTGTGTVTRVEGGADQLIYPAPKPLGPGPHVVYEGQYYTKKPLRIGDTVAFDHVIRTQKNGRIRVVFNFGDLVDIGGSTELRFKPDKLKHIKAPALFLKLGNLRISVKRRGVFSGLRCQMPTMAVELLGGEIFLSASERQEALAAVMRGSIRYRLKHEGATFRPLPELRFAMVAPDSQFATTDTISQDLIDFTKLSTAIANQDLAKPSMRLQSYVNNIEGEALDTMMEDYKNWSDDYGRLLKEKPTTLDRVMAFTVQNLEKKAARALRKKLRAEAILRGEDVDDDDYAEEEEAED